MTVDPGQELTHWNDPFWIQVRAQTLGTLLATAVIAGIGGLAALVAELSLQDAAQFVVLPILLIGILVGLVFTGAVARQRLRQFDRWKALISNHAAMVGHLVQDTALQEVIETARALGWQSAREEGVLTFTSPDHPPDRWTVDPTQIDPVVVARHLHNLDPHHFPSDWRPARSELADRVAEVRSMLAEMQVDLDQRIARAALADVATEAEAAGWSIAWGTRHVAFEKGNNVATVAYTNVDVPLLRKALGLRVMYAR